MKIKGSKIIITGGSGFLGKNLVEYLISRCGVKPEDIFIPLSKEYDLRREADIDRMFSRFKADIVIHLATISGGIGHYKEHAGEVFYSILSMGTKLMEASRKNNVKKFVAIGTALSYPKDASIPYREEDFWNGYPEEIEASYGVASKILQAQSEAYRKQYEFNSIYLIFPSLYGPEDHFYGISPHVIPSIIIRFHENMNKNNVSVWGSGEAKREFLYVEDAVKAIVAAIENYDSSDPLNVGSGVEVSIKEIAETIKKRLNFKGQITWDTAKPEGRLRRSLDSIRARSILKIKDFVGLEEGLRRTINWFLKEHSANINKS